MDLITVMIEVIGGMFFASMTVLIFTLPIHVLACIGKGTIIEEITDFIVKLMFWFVVWLMVALVFLLFVLGFMIIFF